MNARRVLIVDDEADIRVLLKEILSDEGYDVDVAATLLTHEVVVRETRQQLAHVGRGGEHDHRHRRQPDAAAGRASRPDRPGHRHERRPHGAVRGGRDPRARAPRPARRPARRPLISAGSARSVDPDPSNRLRCADLRWPARMGNLSGRMP